MKYAQGNVSVRNIIPGAMQISLPADLSGQVKSGDTSNMYMTLSNLNIEEILTSGE